MNAVATPNVNLVGITGIARRLVQDGALDEAAAREAMTRAGEAKVPLAQWLAEKKLVSAGAMAAANSVEFGMPVIDATAFDPTHNAMKLVSEELVQKHNVLPLFKRGSKLFVGTSNPTQTAHLAEIQFHTNLVVEPILVDEEQIRRVLEQWQNLGGRIGDALGGDDEEGLDNLEVGTGDEDAGSESGVDAKGDDTPVVKFVNKVLIDAIRRGASDIHFEPYETDYRVRLRIDGLLKSVAKAPVKLSPRIAARLKVMAQLTSPRSGCRRTGASSSTCPRPSRSTSASAPCRPCSARRWCCASWTAARPSWASTNWATSRTSRHCSRRPSRSPTAWCW